ncbi:MAG: hypothetical protein MJK04_12475 [Psychrosphaera sp.]|nr:hypothetical protein [Psychrosphaera sp.]
MALFIGSGLNIYQNTTVKNHFATVDQYKAIHANYEQRYRQYANDAVPQMIKINAAVDIYPSQHKVDIKADLVFINNSNQPIKRFLVAIPGYNRVLQGSLGYNPVDFTLDIAGGKMGPLDGELNSHWFEFERPMLPNEKRTGTFSSIRQQQGFSETNPALRVLDNGSFIQNSEIFPRLGYLKLEQLTSAADRKHYGLGPVERANPLEDNRYYNQPMGGILYGAGGGTLDFETTVSTSAEQIAIAPGYLQKQWSVGESRYFHYK